MENYSCDHFNLRSMSVEFLCQCLDVVYADFVTKMLLRSHFVTLQYFR